MLRHLSLNTLQKVLAIGFLLVILSSALWHNYLPLLVVATYVIAPLPNWICGRCANPDDFMESAGSAIVDFGRFMTGFLVVMGVGTEVLLFCSTEDSFGHELSWATQRTSVKFVMYMKYTDKCGVFAALPALLAHCGLIQYSAMAMSIVGGLLIYGTIISFTMFFQEEQEF